MEDIIKEALREEETVLWQSKPEAFETLDKTNKKRFWVTLCICTVVFIAIMALSLFNGKTEVKPSVVVILFVLCAFAPLRRILDANQIRKLRYVVTNQRMLVVSGDVKGVALERVKQAVLRTDADGHLSLLAGAEGVKKRQSYWRDLALIGQPGASSDDEPIDTFGFYAVEDKKGLERVLKQVLPALF